MSLLLDEETVVLEGLDFEVACAHAGHAEADVLVSCRFCGNYAYLCAAHYETSRIQFDCLFLLGGVPNCVKCKAAGATYEELFEVTPL
ncbi:hypothetical protein [Microbacterium resistens]